MKLTEGTYQIADDCTARYEKRMLIVTKKKNLEQIARCRDCVHMKLGRLSMRRQWWDTTYCDIRPKTICGETKYFYNVPSSKPACKDFERKEEQV